MDFSVWKKVYHQFNFSTDKVKCPVPQNTCNVVAAYKEIPLKVLFKNKFDKSSSFALLKNEVDKFIAANKKVEDKVEAKPDSVPGVYW